MSASRKDRPGRVDAFIFTSLGIHAGFMRHCLHFLRFLAENSCEVVVHGFPPALEDANNIASVTVRRGTARLFLHSVGCLMGERGPVLLSTQANHVQVFLAMFAAAVRRPIIYDMQDPVPESFVALFRARFPNFFIALGHRWLMLSEAIICRLASIVCVVSPGMRSMVLARHNIGHKVFLFPNAHSIHPSNAARFVEPTIVFAGGLQPLFRGLETQVDALTLAAARRFRLLIAGEGRREWLDSRIARKGVEQRVKILGFLQPAEVRQLWAQSHLLVIENLAYGLPSKLFEAVAAGVVIVSPSASTDVNAVLGDGAVTFDGSAAGLAEALDVAWRELDTVREKQRRNTEAFLGAVELERRALGVRIEHLALPAHS